MKPLDPKAMSLDEILAKYITRDTHSGSVNRIRQLMEADLVALIDKRETLARIDELREAAFHIEDWDEYAIKRFKALSDQHSSKEDI